MLKPTQDKVLVEPLPRKISETLEVILKEKANVGLVVAVGPGKRDKKDRLQPPDVKVGETVRYGGEDYLSFPEYFDPETLKTYHIISEMDICGVVG